MPAPHSSSRLKIRLARNLRKTAMRGHPWIYREALAAAPAVERAQLAQVSDARGELGWAIYDPNGPLALRMLSLSSAPPNASEFAARFARAWARREGVRSGQTNCYRLFNGEGDGLPGLVCDLYAGVAVVQFDGAGPAEFWDRELIAAWLLENAQATSVVEKLRRENALRPLGGREPAAEIEVSENSARYRVNVEKGQKTGFFLDQRDNRGYARRMARGKSILNLFSYSGGFSVSSGLGGAARATSVDLSAGAIALANENWALNGLEPSRHEAVCGDAFDFLAKGKETWDHVIVDPPSMGHSEGGKAAAIAKYVGLFAAAAKRTAPGGSLSLSSCSSHVSFADFQELADEAISQARRRGAVLRFSGQGEDHPYPQACPELRYLKFMHLTLS